MQSRSFTDLLKARWDAGAYVCVGLDPAKERLPSHFSGQGQLESITEFLKNIVDATAESAAAFKPNLAFFMQFGIAGAGILVEVVEYILINHREIPVILDAKVADIGNTNKGYVSWIFNIVEAHAVTVHPWLDHVAMEPFLERGEKGVIVLCRTTNEGADELQGIRAGGPPLYTYLARRVENHWNRNGNALLVVAGNDRDALRMCRQSVPTLTFLSPGIGAQGGTVTEAVRHGRIPGGVGILPSASRSILYASSGPDFAEAAGREAARLNALIAAALQETA